MNALAPLKSAIGRTWNVRELTAAQSRAYKRPKEPAPHFEAIGPAGSIMRAATYDALAAKVARATHN